MSCYQALLKEESLLHINGPQALAFLQGQTTCDTRRVDSGHALPGAYCTPQGRVVCDFLLCQLGTEHYAMRLRRDVRAASAAVFGKYILFSRAQLDAENEAWQVRACWGHEAAARLKEIFGALPGERYAAHLGEGFALVQLDADAQQFECYLDDAGGSAWRDRLDTAFAAGEETAWRILQIESGIARIEAATTETFVPQMLNYDLTGHISFNKGCYTGQEVVARLHYRGQAKRRMYLARGPVDDETAASPASAPRAGTPQAGTPRAGTPRAGMPLFTGDDGRAVGEVVNGEITEGGDLVALVVATAPGIEAGLHLGAPDGPVLEPGELPYPLPS